LTIDLTPLLGHLPAWLMVMFRITGLFVLAPLLGSNAVPRQIKVYLALGLSLCVYPMLLDPGRPAAEMVGSVVDNGLTLWTLVAQVAMELLIGFAIGFAASLPLVGMQVGGHLVDYQIGLGFAQLYNPEFGSSAGVLSEVFFLMALAVFMILGGHQQMLLALVGSFDRVPLGGFTDFSGLGILLVGLLGSAFEMAFRVAAPLTCLVFLESVAMGFIARTVPQMNILSIGFALRIVVGVFCLIGFLATMSEAYRGAMLTMIEQMVAFFAL